MLTHHYRWKYALFVAIDANFRLKRKAVSSDTADPSLNVGWGYFVRDSMYKSYLADHATEKQEVSKTILVILLNLTWFFNVAKHLCESQRGQHSRYEDLSWASSHRGRGDRLCKTQYEAPKWCQRPPEGGAVCTVLSYFCPPPRLTNVILDTLTWIM